MKFLKEIATHPKKIGAIAPSSKKLAKLMVDSAEITADDVVVEIGPGTGAFTDNIRARISKSSQYVGIEINEKFVQHLRQQYPQITVHHGDAENIVEYLSMDGHDTCQRVISGLPWTSFSDEKQQNLLRQIYTALDKDGLFLTFSYVPFHQLPRGRLFRSNLARIFTQVTKTSVVRNLPPAFIYICQK
ncbi:MAG: rRNA adenine N-6-methyltransferase family protein [Candidatus Paceibacterota bacterium]